MQETIEKLNRLLQQSGPEQALGPCADALHESPDNLQLKHLHGRILNNLGRLPEALAAFDAVLDADPENALVLAHRGHVLRQLGQRDEAGRSFEAALRLDENLVPACAGLAYVKIDRQEYLDAAGLLHRAASIEPGNPMHWYNLASSLQASGHLHDAARAYRRVLAMTPDDIDALCNLGSVLQANGQLEEAATLFRQVTTRSPRHPQATAALAGIHDLHGDVDAGLELLEPWLSGKCPPDSAVDLSAAQLLLKSADPDEALVLLNRVLADDRTGWLQRSTAHFMLAGHFDRQAEYDAAFENAAIANSLRDRDYVADAQNSVAARLMSVFPLADQLAEDGSAPSIVFIVGMPRSGTSLVEQILDSHSGVHGAGELDVMGQFARSIPAMTGSAGHYLDCVADLSGQQRRELAATLREKYSEIADGAPIVSDKMWQNFQQLGLIQALLPGSRIVHCRRDPRDAGLSCFIQGFGVAGPPFSYGLSHIGHYFGLYRRMMAHWRQTLSLPIHDVDYEQLVNDPDRQIPRLLEFLGLETEQACFDFHLNKRTVRTASNEQVRKPMYRSSIGRHRNYDAHLGELYAAFEANGVDYDERA